MEVCQLECEHKKGSVFGVDLSLLPRDRPDEVPFVVILCTSEIESRALSVQVLFILTLLQIHWLSSMNSDLIIISVRVCIA